MLGAITKQRDVLEQLKWLCKDFQSREEVIVSCKKYFILLVTWKRKFHSLHAGLKQCLCRVDVKVIQWETWIFCFTRAVSAFWILHQGENRKIMRNLVRHLTEILWVTVGCTVEIGVQLFLKMAVGCCERYWIYINVMCLSTFFVYKQKNISDITVIG